MPTFTSIKAIPAKWIVALSLGCAMNAGCQGSWFSWNKPRPVATEKKLTPVGPTKVTVDGPALALGQPEQDLQVRRVFLQRYEEFDKEGRSQAAIDLVSRFCDVALEAIRDAVCDEQPITPIMISLAGRYDSICGVRNESTSWKQVLQARKDGDASVEAYAKGRRELVARLRDGEFASAIGAELPALAAATGQPRLQIDALQYEAIAALLADQPGEAAMKFDTAIKLAKPIASHQAAHLLLLRSEALRRDNNNDGANRAWSESVLLASEMLAGQSPVADPTYWDRALYLQPVGIGWPEKFTSTLRSAKESRATVGSMVDAHAILQCGFSESDSNQESAILWACIGCWRLERGEAQSGLLALKRAESMATTTSLADATRLKQAHALVSIGQDAAATALLTELAGCKDNPGIKNAAIAQLGAQKVAAGATAQGITLLKTAIDSKEASNWPGIADAEADLGLAYLLTGNEQEGIDLLHRARDKYRNVNDRHSYAQCLWNEARYFEETGDKKQAATLDAEWKELQL